MLDPQSSETTGYHIFLEPDNSVREHVQGVITTLAEVFGGPVFTPHVTLLARIPGDSDEEIIQKAERLASLMEPFSISLAEVDSRSAYFQACFLKLVSEDQVITYHHHAKEIFDIDTLHPYTPHMSLFYGNLTDLEMVELRSAINLPEEQLVFEVNKLHIYRTPGTVETWEKIAEVLL
jgi:2'-5' RNA ligase